MGAIGQRPARRCLRPRILRGFAATENEMAAEQTIAWSAAIDVVRWSKCEQTGEGRPLIEWLRLDACALDREREGARRVAFGIKDLNFGRAAKLISILVDCQQQSDLEQPPRFPRRHIISDSQESQGELPSTDIRPGAMLWRARR